MVSSAFRLSLFCYNINILSNVYRFPLSNPEVTKVWEHAMHRQGFHATKWSRVCSEHFEPQCFDRTGQTVRLHKGLYVTLSCYLHTHTHNTHTHTTVLQPFLRDHSGEPVPEENFWTVWCKGRLTEADTLTILLGATPSGLTSASTIPLPYSLQAGCPSCHPTNSIKALKATSTFGLGGRRR